MESWYFFAIASAVTVGIHMFIQKVAAERGYSSALLNTWSTGVSTILAICTVLFAGVGGDWKLGVCVGVLGGVMHMVGSIVRMDALRHIDTAIFFPLYKTVGPLVALSISILFFGDIFTGREWIGIIFGITVPLFLLHKSEKQRQNNLQLGLILMGVSAIATALAVAIAKYGADAFDSVFLLVAVSHACGTVFGFIFHHRQVQKNKRNGNAGRPVDRSQMAVFGVLCGVTQFLSFASLLLALSGGSLAVVYTINSFYILIPIVLSIIIYKEHWNARKVMAIGLSLLAVAFLR